MSMFVAVQVISIEWGKAARGGEMATRRVQAIGRFERSLPFPKPKTVAMIQRVGLSDWDGFEKAAERVSEYESLNSANPPELYFDLDHRGLQVQAHSPHPSGMEKPILLTLNETVRFEWNGRIVYEEIWRYSQTRVNVALTERPVQASLFQKPPTYEISNLSQLY
ncbi:hypothetical protein ACMT4L_12045 [Deinococcus sp. A31D244]|uniref:hypothetical protein n=1 Tax=Deinococcus sp. A31D244 TaxID=3397675 RepID=UPI0039E11E9C